MESLLILPKNEHDALYHALGTSHKRFKKIPQTDQVNYLACCHAAVCESPTERRAATTQDKEIKRKADEAFEILSDPDKRRAHRRDVKERIENEEKERQMKALKRQVVKNFNMGQRLQNQVVEMHYEAMQRQRDMARQQMMKHVQEQRKQAEKELKESARKQKLESEKVQKEKNQKEKERLEIEAFCEACPIKEGQRFTFGHSAKDNLVGMRGTVLQLLPRKKKVMVKVEIRKATGELKRIDKKELALSSLEDAVPM